ncbi:hypothetical protein M406DRAFT_330314 [Cryphonectria parasitica EP155]|uniref:Uncharacterized protein n=1 Tax=Cryphonectria parasitica (strain ATCC 38755 / EP155) TaxID=660469 RepID=A0A9P5CQR7_CRYP1|nr:uncharacterized protein M406DRAFT_330314 [Cryphonectria parasitica EP155]KAF3766506.1 hypothetical protein M406DRAFT_330314 [Cryphonectria parasitica EP155]
MSGPLQDNKHNSSTQPVHTPLQDQPAAGYSLQYHDYQPAAADSGLLAVPHPDGEVSRGRVQANMALIDHQIHENVATEPRRIDHSGAGGTSSSHKPARAKKGHKKERRQPESLLGVGMWPSGPEGGMSEPPQDMMGGLDVLSQEYQQQHWTPVAQVDEETARRMMQENIERDIFGVGSHFE